MNREQLFRTVGTEAKHKPYLRKVQMKDAWGSVAWLFKGRVPEWVKEINIPCYEDPRLPTTTFDEYYKTKLSQAKEAHITKTEKVCVFMKNEQVCDMLKVSYNKLGVLVRLNFYEFAKEYFKEPTFTMLLGRPDIMLVRDKGKPAGLIMPVDLSSTIYETITPIEALRRRLTNADSVR